MFERVEAKKLASELEEPVKEARELALKLGLDPYEVNYWIVNQEEMNELIAYGGFHTRYPHWRWGMKYDKQQKQRQYLGGKAFEIVNHDDPANAFLQESNSIADQKAVITHVEAHSDFFANNEWFHLFRESDIDAAAMIEQHADRIEEIIQDTGVDRERVEQFIDHLLTIEDNIDQHRQFQWGDSIDDEVVTEDGEDGDLAEDIEDALDLSDEVSDEIFDEEWLEEQREDDGTASVPAEPEEDLLLFLYRHGKQFDENAGKAVEFEDWQKDVIEILRAESYYFAPQKMTKIMNEGWAAYWESLMMTHEAFAGDDEFLNYADHMAKVLGSGGLNPYKLGIELWKYIENRANRREVIRKLLRVDGVTWRNLHEQVDFGEVLDALEPDEAIATIDSDSLADLDPEDSRVDADALQQAKDGEIDVDAYPWKVLTYEGLAERHFSLCKRANRGFLGQIDKSELEEIARYLVDIDRYDTIDEALADVDHEAGWERMLEIRESHNDVTFLDEFLTQEFVDEYNYFTYEFSHQTEDFRAASTDVEDVKKKLLVDFTNFGKPRMTVRDGNFRNRGELLIAHEYNGIALDMRQAVRVMERLFELWGRPVNLMTVTKELNEEEMEIARRRGREPEPVEEGKRIRYDGEEITEHDLDDDLEEEIMADDVDYDTKPEEWL